MGFEIVIMRCRVLDYLPVLVLRRLNRGTQRSPGDIIQFNAYREIIEALNYWVLN
jgi:hypothetical protein